MALPADFLEHLRTEGYHPRSNKHSNSLATAIAHDLVERCPLLRRRARDGEVVYDLNFDLRVGSSTWNVDLVLGRASEPFPLTLEGQAVKRARPASVDIAVEIKSIMTRHHNNAKNRQRDLEAHHDHVHRYDARTIAGGVFVVNRALSFLSPPALQPTVHAKTRLEANALVEHCLNEMRNVSERVGTTGYGLEAKCFIVLEMDNQNLASTSYGEAPPAPLTGDPLNYDSFIQRICDQYTARFGM